MLRSALGSRLHIPKNALVALLGAVFLVQSGCLCGAEETSSAPRRKVKELKPSSLSNVAFSEGEKGEPSRMGCADGQREGFSDHGKFKDIAGCLGSWDGHKSLRDAPTGTACGDDKGPCTTPADVCATNWHVCGTSGRAQDLSDRIDADACNDYAGPGKFIAAMSHGQSPVVCPPTPDEDTIFPCMEKGLCAETVCCGDGCDFGHCRDAIWLESTKISLGTAEGCGAVSSDANGGILCCRNGDRDAKKAADGNAGTEANAQPEQAGKPAGNGTDTP
ncbi:MAG: hypothetical protein V3V08_10315 [Nannocystaceae bacterium]